MNTEQHTRRLPATGLATAPPPENVFHLCSILAPERFHSCSRGVPKEPRQSPRPSYETEHNGTKRNTFFGPAVNSEAQTTSAYLSEGAAAGSAASCPSRPEHRRHFRSGPRPQLRRDCHIFTQFGSFRIQTVFNPSQIPNSFPAPSATKSDRMLRNVTLSGGFPFNSGPPSGAPPTPSPFKKDCRRRRPRASVECAGAYLAPPLL